MNIRVFTLLKGTPEVGAKPLEVYIALPGREEGQERTYQVGTVEREPEKPEGFAAHAIYPENGEPYYLGYYNSYEQAMLALGVQFTIMRPETLDPAVRSEF